MKKLLFSLAVLSAVAVTAQVGINTDTPQATLDISAKDNQKGDLRIEGVKEEKFTQWLLVWDEKDQKVKRTSLSDLKWDIIIVDNKNINYIRETQPDRADEIINKIKQCPPENIIFDKYFGGTGVYDFVYCATTVSGDGYNKTWLNLNLGAEYANIHSPNFNPTVNKTGETIHDDENLYGSYYQWQRESDGHERKNSGKTIEKAYSWTSIGDSSRGKFITSQDGNWVENGEGASGLDLELWRAGVINSPCPSGYHVPTLEEWQELLNAVGSNQMWRQNKLPNLAAAGYRRYNDGSLERMGSLGYYWSSSAYGSSGAHNMDFSSGSSVAYGGYHRAYGNSVRCLKD
ncbi:Fibrobacter succinogenes major paralogous domain [Candidatus Ornithobacterium hominis]|uniref:FISUMP domain-containing protein n=1 Tax=Candidatus Ornithobacterium hominis TaxID=2497989 RepID=UPI0024BBFCF5|nr:FISUMP domain-containing protein [Candidatus Ornithobacterium hominis]CAI9428993.1 Fibrobacter succinogenes major paralogous domain [Candidatus Ornithobacterium hominis]